MMFSTGVALYVFFFNDPATTELYTYCHPLSLHDALPISLDAPAAIFGGYRMTVEKDGMAVDDRIVHIIERDEKARRLSLFANYLLFPGGLEVYATYQAQPTATRTRYAIDRKSTRLNSSH